MNENIKNAIDWLKSLKVEDFTKDEDGEYYYNGEADGSIYKCVTSTGVPTFEFKKALRENGFSVFAGDKDSFGWLTGVIRFSNPDSPMYCYMVIYG